MLTCTAPRWKKHWAPCRVCTQYDLIEVQPRLRIQFQGNWEKVGKKTWSLSTEHQNSQVSWYKALQPMANQKQKKYRPSGRMRIRTTVQLWVGLQTETGQMSTQDRLVEMWNTRGWTWEDCEISLGWKMVTGNVTYSYWKNWFVWSRKCVLDIVWVIWSVLNAMLSCGFKKRILSKMIVSL